MSETTAVAAPQREAAADRSSVIAKWSFVVSLALILVAGVVALWRFREWVPVSDLAILELQLRQIRDSLPLVGAYSRYGWSHPGPLFHYLMWLPWRLTGGTGVGLLLGMLILHLGALVLAWLAVRRRSTAAGVLVVAALLLAWAGADGSTALAPWNPYVALLLGGTLLVVAWNAADRGRLGAVLLLPLGSVLVQSHAGTTLLVVGACLVAVVLAVLPQGHGSPLPFRWWLGGAGVAAVLWLPTVWDQIVGSGNVTRMLAGLTTPHLGVGRGVSVLGDALSVTPYWWSPDPASLPESTHPPVLLLIPLAATVVAVVRRSATGLRFMTLAWVSLAAALASVARASDPSSYLVAWLPAVVGVVLAVSVWILIDAADWERPVRLASPLLLLLPAIAVTAHLTLNDPPLAERIPPVVAAVEVGVAAADGTSGVHVAVPGDEDALSWIPAVTTELQRRGISTTAAVPQSWPATLQDLMGGPREGRAEVLVRRLQDPSSPVPDGWQVAAESDPFSEAEWAELRRLRAIAADPASDDLQRYAALVGVAELEQGRIAWQVLVPVG